MRTALFLALVLAIGCGPRRRVVAPPNAPPPQPPRIENESLPAPEGEPGPGAEPAAVERAPVAVAFVIDRSGSMMGLPLAMARDAVVAAASDLRPADLVTVIGFDSEPRFVVEMGRLELQRLAEAVAAMEPGGGTHIEPALKLAYDALGGVGVANKHAIVLTDGRAPSAGIAELVGTMTAAGIHLTTVGLGDETDAALLEQMASAGGGRHYSVRDPSLLVRVFREEIAAVVHRDR
jgi:Mg-chelatase subunit ChlD